MPVAIDPRAPVDGRSPRRIGLALAFLLAGFVGVGWWCWRRRRRGGGRRGTTVGRASAVLFAGVLLLGAVYRTLIALGGVPSCPTDGGTAPADSPAAVVGLEKAATWPVTGLAMAYAQIRHGYRCLASAEGLYYDEHQSSFFFGGRSLTVGDVFLSRYRTSESEMKRQALFDHERHHRRQWALGTVIGGPLAFPIAYTVDDFFFPGARNHFEQEAGLARGGYDPATQSGPKLGLKDVGVLFGAAAAAELVRFRRRRGWRAAPGADTVRAPLATPDQAT